MARIDGYFSEFQYPTVPNMEFAPAHIASAMRSGGFRPPRLRGPIRVLDIGCGDGINLALMAAAYPEAEMTGIDAMEVHIARGQAFAERHAIRNLTLRCETFAETLARADAPYDYIICQGVIAWVSPENRARVFEIAGRFLAPGGAFCVGYNAMPGWQERLTMQRMLRLWSEADAGGGDAGPASTQARFEGARAHLAEIARQGAASLPPEPLDELVELAARLPAGYFPHEYLNDHWQPLWWADVRAAMAAQGLSYACETRFLRHRADFSLKKAERAMMEAVADPVQRESMADLFNDTTFRVDIYAREAVAAPRQQLMGEVCLAAKYAEAEAPYSGKSRAGTLRFDNQAAHDVLGALGNGPRAVFSIIDASSVGRADLLNAVDVLLAAAHVLPVAPGLDDESFAGINRRLLLEAKNEGAMAVQALIGTNGPVATSASELRILSHDAEELLARARADADFFDAVFSEDFDLEGAEAATRIASVLDGLKTQFRSLGVILPDL